MLIPLISGLLGEKGPLGQYFKIKSDKVAAEETYRLRTLEAQTRQIETEAKQVEDRLNSTSQDFKQYTFWFIAVPVVITMCPWTSLFAVTMWANFALIPEWFQILFVSVYSSIWGLPIAKEYLGGMFKSLGGAMEARREFKLEKARINRKVFMDNIKEGLFPKGMNQAQVDLFDKALDAGENSRGNV